MNHRFWCKILVHTFLQKVSNLQRRNQSIIPLNNGEGKPSEWWQQEKVSYLTKTNLLPLP